MDKAIQDQIEMATEFADVMAEGLDESITANDILDYLAVAGLSLMPTTASPVNPEITLASEAYFANLA